MSIKAATLIAEIDVDTKGAERKIGAFGKTMGSLVQGAVMGVGIAAAQGLMSAAQGAMRGMGGAVQAASDLNETVSKTNFILGESAKQMMGWSKNAATAFGMTQNSALQAASNFAVFGKAAGLTGDNLAGFSQQLVELSADFASFYNTSPEQAIMAIGAALRGESEPIRQYGVLLNEATLKQRAMALGIISTTKEALTPQQRVLAAQAEILAQTSDAQGDFARTSDQLANQQRVMAAQMETLTTTAGAALLPAFQELYRAGNQLLSEIMPHLGTVMEMYVAPAMLKVAEGIRIAGERLGVFMELLARGGDPVGSFVEAFDLKPVVDEINSVITATENMVVQLQIGFNFALHELSEFIGTAAREYNELLWRMQDMGIGVSDSAFWRYSHFGTNPENFTPKPPNLGLIPTESGPLGKLPDELSDAMTTVTRTTFDMGDAFADMATTVGNTDKALSDLESALGKIPGLFGTSAVTQSDMDRAAAGLPVNYADNYLRRARDEMMNGIDWADIDPAEVAASVGLDPSVPAQIIIDELTKQWESGEYFANPENLAKIDWQAVKDAALKEANAVLGKQNIMAEALAQGVTIESFKPMATDGVGKMASAITGALTTPENSAALEDAGESAYGWIFRGMQTAASKLPMPPPTGYGTPGGPIGPPTAPTQSVTLPNGFQLTVPLPGNARGSDWWPGGPTWVGEEGAEIVVPPRGSRIIPNDMAGGVNVTVNASVASDLDIDRLALRLANVIDQNRRRRR